MTSTIATVTIDCRNAHELSEWWKPVLGYADAADDPNEPGDEECLIRDPDGAGQALLFIEVPDERVVKNRLHLDLRPRTGTRDEEVARLLAHGATEVDDRRDEHGPGTGWVVMADPEGNEFCVLRSAEERKAAGG